MLQQKFQQLSKVIPLEMFYLLCMDKLITAGISLSTPYLIGMWWIVNIITEFTLHYEMGEIHKNIKS